LEYYGNFNIIIVVVFADDITCIYRHCQECDTVCTPEVICSFGHAAVPAATCRQLTVKWRFEKNDTK